MDNLIIYLILIIPSLVIFLLIIRFPIAAMLLLFAFCFVDTRPYPVFKTIEKAIFFFGFISAFYQYVRAPRFGKEWQLFYLFIFLIILLLSSALINGTPLVNILYYLYGEGKIFIALAIFMMLSLSKREVSVCLLFIIAILLIQIPFLFYQGIESGFVRPQLFEADIYTGTTGADRNTVLALVAVSILGLLVSFLLETTMNKWLLIIGSLYCILIIIITESKTLIVVSVLCLAIFLFIRAITQRKAISASRISKLKILSIILLVVFCFTAFYAFLQPEEFGRLALYDIEWFRLTTNLYGYELLWELNTSSVKAFLFGQGPGETMSAASASLKTPFYMENIVKTYDPDEISLSIAGAGISTFGAFGGDLGIIGIIYYLVFIVLLYRFIQSKNTDSQDTFFKAIDTAALFLLIYLFVWGGINASFEDWVCIVPFGVCLSYLNSRSCLE